LARLTVEKTVAWQVEGPGDSYCCTTYSKQDALVCRELAKDIPRLKCLKQSATSNQPKGLYVYLTEKGTGDKYPEIEVYDKRLEKKVRENLSRFKGDLD